MKAAIAVLLLFAGSSLAQEPTPRGTAAREFRKLSPCPSTGKTTGACVGFVADHAVPLCWGGPDSPDNLQWQPLELSYKKDAFERAACKMRRELEKLRRECKP